MRRSIQRGDSDSSMDLEDDPMSSGYTEPSSDDTAEYLEDE